MTTRPSPGRQSEAERLNRLAQELARKVLALQAQVEQGAEDRVGVLPFLCPICDRKRMEYTATADGRLLVECTKCGADHDTICDAALEPSKREAALREVAEQVRTGLGLTAYEGTPVSVWSAKHYADALGRALSEQSESE